MREAAYWLQQTKHSANGTAYLVTVAAIDRLVHHADIYKIGRDGYRKKHALKSNTKTGQSSWRLIVMLDMWLKRVFITLNACKNLYILTDKEDEVARWMLFKKIASSLLVVKLNLSWLLPLFLLLL